MVSFLNVQKFIITLPILVAFFFCNSEVLEAGQHQVKASKPNHAGTTRSAISLCTRESRKSTWDRVRQRDSCYQTTCLDGVPKSKDLYDVDEGRQCVLAAIAKARSYYDASGGNVECKAFNENTASSQFEIRQWGVILCNEYAPAWQGDIEAFENAWLSELGRKCGLGQKAKAKKGGQPLTDAEEFNLKACERIAEQTVKIAQNRAQRIKDAQAKAIEEQRLVVEQAEARKRKQEAERKRKQEAERKRQEDAEFRRKQDEAAKTFAKEACAAKRHVIQDALSESHLRERLNRPVAVRCRGQQRVLLKAALALTDIEANDDRLDVYLEDYDYFIYRVQKDANLKGVPGRDLLLGNVLDILKNASSEATDFTTDFKSAGETCSKSEEYREAPVRLEVASGIDLKSIDKNDMDGVTKGIAMDWQAKNKFRITGYLTQSQIEKLLDEAEMTSDYSDAEQTCEAEKQRKIDNFFAQIEQDAAKECESKLSQTTKKKVQVALREEVGFSGSVDGNLDGTREAIKLWQKSEDLAQSGYVDCEQEKVLIANNADAILEYIDNLFAQIEQDAEKQLAALEEPAKTDTGADQKPAMGALEIPLDEPKDLVVPESYKEIEMLLSMLLVDQSIDSFVDMIGKLATKKGTAEIAGMFGLKQDGAAIKRTELKALQFALKEEGLYKSSIDGLWGRGTSRALSKWLANQGYPGDRVINKYDISRLIILLVEEIDKNKEKVKEAERKLLEESKRARDEKPKKVESQAVIKEIPPKLAPDNFDPSSCEFGTKNALVFEGGSQTTKTVCKTGDEGKNDDGEGGVGGDDSNCTN
ncbi:cell envelope integrity protein TolA [Paracoccaceae bacterium]|nr:cell envelope integrity protein TolA [Paracoccaceae bacterium]